MTHKDRHFPSHTPKKKKNSTFRHIVSILQSVCSALERGKRLELDHFPKLCKVMHSLLNLLQLGANLFRLHALKQGVPRCRFKEYVVDLYKKKGKIYQASF